MRDVLTSLTKVKITPKFYQAIPETAGVYVFYTEKEPIYVGKAINLRHRVSSYFDINLEPKTAKMISEATKFAFIKVASELEALLLEARLIRKYMPRYNIAAKDDKHPLYIQITDEKFPRVITARKIAEEGKNLAFYGPFPSSGNVRSVLKMLRRIFPFSDHKIGKRACLYSHIGLCNPCPNQIIGSTEYGVLRCKYLGNINHIKSILDGKIDKVRTSLALEMKKASKETDFEKAAVFRNQIQKLEYITSPQIPTDFYIQNPNLYEDIRTKELAELKKMLVNSGLKIEDLQRIECFDVAHLAGTKPTASMITFVGGEADKKYYRHFKINQKHSNDDYASLNEVIERRKKHFTDWGKPDLIIVDGGKGQVSVFLKALKGENIPVVGLAKKFETLVIPSVSENLTILSERRLPRGNILNLIQRIRDEAHRFARVYHHKLISKEFNSN